MLSFQRQHNYLYACKPICSLSLHQFISRLDSFAKYMYFNERVYTIGSLSVCLSVCLSVHTHAVGPVTISTSELSPHNSYTGLLLFTQATSMLGVLRLANGAE